jgi:hypothetical protein
MLKRLADNSKYQNYEIRAHEISSFICPEDAAEFKNGVLIPVDDLELEPPVMITGISWNGSTLTACYADAQLEDKLDTDILTITCPYGRFEFPAYFLILDGNDRFFAGGLHEISKDNAKNNNLMDDRPGAAAR